MTHDRSVETMSVHVIDDDADVRASIEWTLRTEGYAVKVHASAQDFHSQQDECSPSCLVIDLLMPGMTGLQLCREIANSLGTFAFVMMSGHGDVSAAVEAMKLGAVDFLEKPCSRQKLLDAVQRASTRLLSEVAEIREEEQSRRQIEQLTAREKEVFEQMSQGRVTKEIAARLGISPKTVDVHRSRISQKLRFDSPTQMGRFVAIEHRRLRRVDQQHRD